MRAKAARTSGIARGIGRTAGTGFNFGKEGIYSHALEVATEREIVCGYVLFWIFFRQSTNRSDFCTNGVGDLVTTV
jgi:hypothetical protein